MSQLSSKNMACKIAYTNKTDISAQIYMFIKYRCAHTADRTPHSTNKVHIPSQDKQWAKKYSTLLKPKSRTDKWRMTHKVTTNNGKSILC